MTKYLSGRGEKISNWERCQCGNLSEMHCICEGTYDTRDHDPNSYDYAISHYKILKCPSCDQILILRYVTAGTDADEFEREKPYLEYEREILYAPAKKRHYSIPDSIADIITQAEKVTPTSPRAAFVLCRAALEQICREQSVPETRTNSKGEIERLDLKKRLNLLLQKEKLSNDLREIMHGIREIGNIFTHESQAALPKKISQAEVEILIGLVDYVLNRLYVDKSRTQEAIKELNLLKDKLDPNQKVTKDTDDNLDVF